MNKDLHSSKVDDKFDIVDIGDIVVVAVTENFVNGNTIYEKDTCSFYFDKNEFFWESLYFRDGFSGLIDRTIVFNDYAVATLQVT